MLARLTIRARITLGSILIAAAIFAIAIFAVRAQVATVLSEADATLAATDLTAFEADILAHPEEVVDDPGTGVLVLVRAPDGTAQVDTVPHAIHEILEHREAANEQFTVVVHDTTFVVVGRIVAASNGDWSLWSARSEASSDLALRGLDTVFITGGVALLAGFGLASWFLASAALRPVERMRRQAETLSTEPGAAGLPVGEAHDELAQLATTLNAFLDRVRRAAEREKQMVSDAAHELRTPIAALRTQLELAHDDFGNAEALSGQVMAAEASVGRLASLAGNLLELSKLEQGTAGTGTSTADELLSEAMVAIDRARMLGLPSAAEITFDCDVPVTTARYALSAESFGRLADNLLSNAIAAVGRGGEVMLTLRQGEHDLVLEVADNGPGIPEDFLPVAFDRFSRADQSRSSSTGGSGLGLALVHAIVAAANGTVTLRNATQGVVATVTVPNI